MSFEAGVSASNPVPRNSIITDAQTGATTVISPSGTQETGELIRLIGGNFESGVLLDHIWTTALTGTGSAASVTGEAVLATGATANSSAMVQTVRRARFVTATFNKTHLAMQMPGFNNADVIRKFGFYDPVTMIGSGDGVFLENDSGAIRLVRLRAGVEEQVVLEAAFNGNDVPGTDGVKFVRDGDVHIYEMVYNAGSVRLFQDLRLVHTMSYLTSVGYETTHLPIAMELVNINGNTVNNELKSRGFSCSRIGSEAAVPEPFNIIIAGSDTIKNSPARLRSVIVTNPGSGAATIEFFDSPTPGLNRIFGLSTSAKLVVPLNFETSNGLSFTATGNNFEILIIFD